MKRIILFAILAVIASVVYGSTEKGVLNRRAVTMPDVDSKVWDFSSAETTNEKKGYLMFWEVSDSMQVWYERADRYNITFYCQNRDTTFFLGMNSRLFEVISQRPVAYFIKGMPSSMPFTAKGEYSVTRPVREEGELSWVPETPGTIVLSPGVSLPARMSRERIDFVARIGWNADSTITAAEADTLPHYSLSIYRWMIEGRKWPAAVMTVTEEKDGSGRVLESSEVAYCMDCKSIGQAQTAEPKNIEVNIHKGGFTFRLPEGFKPTEAEIAVTTSGGILYHSAVISLQAGETFNMSLPDLPDGQYIVAVTIDGASYKNLF